MWLALAGAFLVVEILTLSLIFFSFAFAAAVGGLCAAIWVGSSMQWVGFAVTAVVSLSFIRPLVKKYLFLKPGDSKTGVDALLSSEAVALTEITSSTGTIRLHNETWTARCEEHPIAAGAKVYVTRIDGAVAIVSLHKVSPKS